MNTFETNVPKQVTEKGDNILYPFGPPIFQSDVDQNFIEELLEKGSHLTRKDDDWRMQLAGNMKSGGSYIFKDDFIIESEKYLIQYVQRFFDNIIERYGDSQINAFLDKQIDRRKKGLGTLKLDTMWINYQHGGDFNPPHSHRGGLSFVIFCKVPKNMNNSNVISNANDPGQLFFQYGEQITKLMQCAFKVNPYDGLLLLFPSSLTHYVPSFWTDEERISVSGNFVVV